MIYFSVEFKYIRMDHSSMSITYLVQAETYGKAVDRAHLNFSDNNGLLPEKEQMRLIDSITVRYHSREPRK